MLRCLLCYGGMFIGAARRLHNEMIEAILNAPINLYYDVTPIGTIMNRFSSDIDMLSHIFIHLSYFNLTLFSMVTVIIIIAANNYYTLIVLPVMFAICYYLWSYQIVAYKDTKRIESITKSPILNTFNESRNGSSVIRAFGKEQEFIDLNY